MDAARFFAALTVVTGHALGMAGWPLVQSDHLDPASWTFVHMASFGHEAVMVFFVLSGFWISHSVARLLDGERFWSEFLTDRLSRLFIVLVPTLAFGALLDLLGAGVFHGTVYWGQHSFTPLQDGVYNHLTPWVFAGNLLFLQGLAVSVLGTNGPLWSIAYEFWYYLWFAGLVASIHRRRLSPVLLTLVLGAIWPSLMIRFPIWLMGSLVYFADRHWAQRSRMSRGRARLLLGAGALFFAAALVIVRLAITSSVVSDQFVGLAFSLVLWGLLRDALRFPPWLALFARYGAGASFSLYAIHVPLFAFVLSVAASDPGAGLEPLALVALVLALCLLAVAVGGLFARITEAKTGQLRRILRLRLRIASSA
jgi:peptidoglycan/LPS O-acetylase OafA/YrhL